MNVFRFGNSGREESRPAVKIPVEIGQVQGYIAAAVVRGDVPLLLSKPLLKALQGRMDFTTKQISFDAPGATVDLEETKSGNYIMPV
eukprot:5752254-Pyramimonas_sp.AAC.1